jgi:hypothetical protein
VLLGVFFLALVASAGETQEKKASAIVGAYGQLNLDYKAPGRPVGEVNFSGAKVVPDRALDWLRHLPHLRRVILQSTPITDASVAHLKGLDKLQGLVLTSTQVGTAGWPTCGG